MDRGRSDSTTASCMCVPIWQFSIVQKGVSLSATFCPSSLGHEKAGSRLPLGINHWRGSASRRTRRERGDGGISTSPYFAVSKRHATDTTTTASLTATTTMYVRQKSAPEIRTVTNALTFRPHQRRRRTRGHKKDRSGVTDFLFFSLKKAPFLICLLRKARISRCRPKPGKQRTARQSPNLSINTIVMASHSSLFFKRLPKKLMVFSSCPVVKGRRLNAIRIV